MKMEYYKNPVTGDIYAYDQAQVAAGFVADGLNKMTVAEVKLHLNPPLTPEQIIQSAENERHRRINAANDAMSARQWPGKAAIGRLSGGDLAQYALWLDYLDALYAVDISAVADILWPTPPADPAS